MNSGTGKPAQKKQERTVGVRDKETIKARYRFRRRLSQLKKRSEEEIAERTRQVYPLF